MLLLMLAMVKAQEIAGLVACLDLVKRKIDSAEAVLDRTMAQSALHPEKLIDKLIADMLQHCSEEITDEIIAEIANKPEEIAKFDYLLNFMPQIYTSEEELELNEYQQLILSRLENYTKKENEPLNWQQWYFLISFTAVVVFVAVKKLVNSKKWFKLE
jgi:hypothetical protein